VGIYVITICQRHPREAGFHNGSRHHSLYSMEVKAICLKGGFRNPFYWPEILLGDFLGPYTYVVHMCQALCWIWGWIAKPKVETGNSLMVVFLFIWLRWFSSASSTSIWEEKALAGQILLVIFSFSLFTFKGVSQYRGDCLSQPGGTLWALMLQC